MSGTSMSGAFTAELARIAAIPRRPGPPPTHPDGTFVFTEARGLSRAAAAMAAGACPRCGGQGMAPAPPIPGEPPRFGRCRCRRPLDQAQQYNAAQIPARYGACGLEDWREQPLQRGVVSRALRWVEEAEDRERHPTLTKLGGLAFCGEPGRGKTHLALGLARRLVLGGQRPVSVRYVEPNQLLQTMKARMGRAAGEAVDIGALVAVDVLVLDDMVAPRTDFERSVLDELITRRWQYGGPTLLTTNLTAGEAASALGARAASRLSALEWLPMSGLDLRRRGAA